MNKSGKTCILLCTIAAVSLSKETVSQERTTEKKELYSSASSTVYHYSYRLLKNCPMTRESFENTMAKGKLRRWRSTPMMQTYHKRYKEDDRCWHPVVFHAEWSINHKGDVFNYKTINKGSQLSHFNRTINGWISWAIKSTVFPGFADEDSICQGGLLLIYCEHYRTGESFQYILP
jgi:hypothetical protein